MQKLKLGDQVQVIAGRDKGRVGTLTTIINDAKVIVEGVNMIKKHVKPDPSKDSKGGIVEKESAIHVSNIAMFNKDEDKRSKVGFKKLEDGQKVRFFKSTGEVIDV